MLMCVLPPKNTVIKPFRAPKMGLSGCFLWEKLWSDPIGSLPQRGAPLFQLVAAGCLGGTDSHKGNAAQFQDPIELEAPDPPPQKHADMMERCGAHDDEKQ